MSPLPENPKIYHITHVENVGNIVRDGVDEKVRPRLIEQGATECLFKPLSDTALLNVVNAALRVN
jgi:hypothetical protein